MTKVKIKYSALSAFITLIATLVIYLFFRKNKAKANKDIFQKVDKFKKYYQLTNQWLMLKNMNKTIADYLINKGYKSIAIYGMGELGNRLYEDLVNSPVEVIYAIDKYPDNNFAELRFCELSEDMEPVDLIIVTPVFDYDDIQRNISSNVSYNILSLEDIIYDI